MTLQVIQGLPGSGKSCYAIDRAVKMLFDWAVYKYEKEKPYPRTLYTNIPIDIGAMNEHLTEQLGKEDYEVDLSDQIVILDNPFFYDENGDYTDWWSKFDVGAFIIIDEVHHYLPASIKRQKGGQKYADKFKDYISMHRHEQHDIILLSQHIRNVSTEVRKMVQDVYNVINIKNVTIGRWPFTLPMSDVDVVRESWGFPQQLAHISHGMCHGERVTYDKHAEVFLLTPTLFRLYQSHTKSSEAMDRPSLKMSRWKSIAWLMRRNGFRLGFWTMAALAVLFGFFNLISKGPGVIQKTLTGGLKPATFVQKQEKTETDTPYRVVLPETSVNGKVDAEDQIFGFVRGGVITQRGVVRVDEHLFIDGEKDFVAGVDVVRGILYLGSGKKVQK